MEDIIRITIKGSSGYVPVDEAYEDRLVITQNSIGYEYKPHEMSESETNVSRKWSYKTTSPLFRELYKQVAEMTPRFLYNEEYLFTCDIGPTSITATFADKHRETVNYFCPSEFFADYFRIIKKMVPGCEFLPAVLLTEDDYNND